VPESTASELLGKHAAVTVDECVTWSAEQVVPLVKATLFESVPLIET
jgi:hypothetical protein